MWLTVRFPPISTLETQKLLCKAFTEQSFLVESSKILGVISLGLIPSSQEESQNDARRPSPTTTFVAEAKIYLSFCTQGFPKLTQGLAESVQAAHSQRIRRSAANFSRFRMPNPPCTFDLHTWSQLILHLPPVTLSQPAPR
ncbi:hypothetical protein ACQJBY_033202 [Aegilops geniculata]